MNLFRKDVSISEIGRDGFGDPVETLVGTFKGHLEYDRKNVFTRDGQEVTTESIVYVDQSAGLKPNSEYKIEVDGLEMTSEVVKFIEDPRGKNRNNHWEIDCR
jgi:hypothetical protein